MGTGLRKVINSLITAVKNIDSPKSVLAKLGIQKDEILDANGNLKSMTDVMGILQKHTEGLDKTEKGAIFNSLFGTTGQQAGMILAENSEKLGELTQKTQDAAESGKYVQTLAEKNSQTAQANVEKFKKAWEDLTIKFGAELLPYMTDATKSLSDLFSQKDFQKDVENVAQGIGKVAGAFVKISEFAMKHTDTIIDLASIMGKLWVVDKVTNFVLKIKKLTEVFGSFGTKIKKEQAEISALTTEYVQLAQAKEVASNAYSGGSKTGKTVASAEQLSATTTYYPSSTGKTPKYKNVGTTVAKEVEEGIATSGAVEAGIAKSADVATKGAGLATKLSKVGAGIAGLIGVGFTAFDVGKDIYSAIKKGTESSQVKAATNLAGTTIGAGIGFALGGPGGAAIGAGIGNAVGSTNTVQKITKGIKKAFETSAKMQAKQNYYVTPEGVVVKLDKVKTDKPSLSKAQKRVVKELNSAITGSQRTAMEMSVKVDEKSLDKSKSKLENYYSSIVKIAQKQSEKRADAEKKVAKELYEQHKISKQQYDEYIKSIDSSDKKRKANQEKTYKDLTKLTDKYNADLKRINANGEADLNQVANVYKKKRTKLAKDEAAAIKGAKESGYVQIGKKIYSGEEAIRKIQEQYKKKRQKLAKDEAKEQKQLTNSTAKEKEKAEEKYAKARLAKLKSLSKNIAKEMTSSSKKQTAILNELKNGKTKISNEEAKKIINNSAKEANKVISHAQKVRKDTIKETNATYDKKVATYKKMAKDIPGYTKEMMNRDISNAKNERDVTISAADESKDKVIASAKAKHNQVIDYASKQNKSVSRNVVAEGNNGIRAYNAWGSAAHNTLSFLSKAWSAIVKSFGGSYSGSVAGYGPQAMIAAQATGGVAKSGPTLVGEAGPELVYTPWAKTARIVGQRGAEVTTLRQGEQVLNANDTAKVMSGNYTGTLPGYANGTFSLSGLISGLKDKVLDVADDILDTLKKPTEWITKGFNQWASVQAFDFTKSSLMDQTRDSAKKSLIKPVTNAFKKLAKAYEDSQGTMANVSGGASAWTDIIKKVARKMEVNLTSGGLSAILRRINQESRGSATVANNWDSNAKAGHPSKGLLQYIQPTLNTWAAYSKGFGNNILNGSDQIAAMFNDSNWLRDISVSGGWGPTGHKRFANGGLVTAHQIIEVAENNMPEMIIPLDLSKRSRAYQLMGQVMTKFRKDGDVNGISTTIDTSVIEQKLDQMMAMFGQMIGLSAQQIKATKDSAFDKNALYRQQARDQRLTDFQSF